MITGHNEYNVGDDVEAVVGHISADMWMVAEEAADQKTTAEAADVRPANEAAA